MSRLACTVRTLLFGCLCSGPVLAELDSERANVDRMLAESSVVDLYSGPLEWRLSPWAYGAAAVGAVGFGAYGAFDAMNHDLVQSELATCLARRCGPEQLQRPSLGLNETLWAQLGLTVGVLGLGTAVTLWVLEEDEQQRTTLVLSPSGLFVRGKM